MLSDGEIYYNIRRFEKKGDTISALSYKNELSKPKRRAVDSLGRHEMVRNALDEVIEFEGLRSGLELSNIAKVFACNCDDMVTLYIQGITEAWNYMTLGEKGSVDEVTVRNFETRAPCANSADRDIVTSLMDAGIAFSKVRDQITRSKMKTRIFKLRRVIPSLATFHRNMNYIRIAAKILRTHLDIPQELFHTTQTTLKERLAEGWPHGRRPLVEVEEGQFLPLIGESSSQIAFEQLFLSVLRNFPYLSTEQPLRDIRSEAMPAAPDTRQLYMLFQRASMLGFSNEKIKKGLLQTYHGFRVPSFKPRINEPISDWRCGKPYVRSFLALRKISFLPDVGKCGAFFERPTVEFVYQDLITAFFGKQQFILDHTAPRIFIDEADPSIQHLPMVRDSDAEPNGQKGAVAMEAPEIGMEMGTETIESDAHMSDVARAMERGPGSSAARTRRLKQRRARKVVLEKFQAIRRHSEDHVTHPGRQRRMARIRQKDMNRQTRLGSKRQESTATDEDPPQRLNLPHPIESPDGFDENNSLFVHPQWPDTRGGRNAIPVPDLPLPALHEAGNNQMAIQRYDPQHGATRPPLILPMHPHEPTEAGQMAIQRYIYQHRTTRVPPPIPSMHPHEPTEVEDDQMAIHRYVPQQGDIPVSAHVSSAAIEYADVFMPKNPSSDGNELLQEPPLPVHDSGAEQSIPEIPDEEQHASSRGSTWTDLSPIVDHYEAPLRQNASIGQLIPAEYDESTGESILSDYSETVSEPISAEHDEGIDEFRLMDRIERKRKRDSNLTSTDGIQEGGRENIQAKEVVHKVRKILPLKGTQRNGEENQERQFQLDYKSHEARTEASDRRGEEISIRRAQSRRPGKRRRFEGAFIGTDQDVTTQDMKDVALTPADPPNIHHAPIYGPQPHRPQPRAPLDIPGEYNKGFSVP